MKFDLAIQTNQELSSLIFFLMTKAVFLAFVSFALKKVKVFNQNIYRQSKVEVLRIRLVKMIVLPLPKVLFIPACN